MTTLRVHNLVSCLAARKSQACGDVRCRLTAEWRGFTAVLRILHVCTQERGSALLLSRLGPFAYC